MANVVRLFAVPSTGSLISLIQRRDHWELLIRSETGRIYRRTRLEPHIAKALIKSIRSDDLAQQEDVEANLTAP